MADRIGKIRNMPADDAGGRLRAARMRVGLTQLELASRMGTGASVICRVETGRCSPTVEFLERCAQALGMTIEVSFGAPRAAAEEERFRRAWRAFSGIGYRHGRYFPREADQIFRTRTEEDPADLYVEMIEQARPGSMDDWRYRDWQEPFEIRGPTAIAAMYYEVIDWPAVRKRLASPVRRLDAKVRRRAREIVAGRSPVPATVKFRPQARPQP